MQLLSCDLAARLFDSHSALHSFSFIFIWFHAAAPIFLSSTVNGYEGTGRSLSLKLIEQARPAAYPTRF
jgi:hypothetical protein